jgi:peptidoglycan/LPS O-acetylase OafA/YrhL
VPVIRSDPGVLLDIYRNPHATNAQIPVEPHSFTRHRRSLGCRISLSGNDHEVCFTAHTQLVAKGYIMVDLFFIMSGFIICHVYQDSFRFGFSNENFRQFTVARFARVYPLHFITLILCIVLFVPKWGWDAVDDPKAIITNVFLIHSFGIHKIFTWNVPSWSISAEWWAYMIFPFLVIFLYRKKKLAIGLLILFVVLSYLGIIYWIPRKSWMDPTQPALLQSRLHV